MKRFTRLCALFCTLAMLLGAVACTDSPSSPADTTGDTATETDAGTSADTVDDTAADTETPETAPETPADTADSDTAPETHPDTEPDSESESEPEETVDELALPDGYVCLYEGSGLAGVSTYGMVVKAKTDGDGTAYTTYNPRDDDPYVYFNMGKTETRLTDVRYVRIKYRTDKATEGQVFVGNEAPQADGYVTLPWQADGEWHVLTVDLMNAPTYDRHMSLFRLDPVTDRDQGAVDVAWIAGYPDDGAPDPHDPIANLPDLPENAPNLSGYAQTADKSVYYKASGYLSGGNGTYTFKEGFALDLYRSDYFNRYTVKYDSTAPLRGEITYLILRNGGRTQTYTEEFFLEAGTNMTFSSLIDGYFEELYGCTVEGVTLKTADGSTADFTLRSVTTNVVDVVTAGTYYLENDRYILGVLLEWGGTISYIEDKQDGDGELGNLINRYDPGRLVQQSYYGVKDGPDYTGSYYGETLWQYNPVQGGNLYGKSSKLVDFQVLNGGKSVYIKCRPMDWAKEDSLTPSYMENTYTLREDGIHVANRFVDFYGVKHPAHHFELPAFYTVSYLGVFHYYNGTKPWTNDAYTTLPNEPFWAGNQDAYHKFAKSNTETWAAWTNTAGYGIGLYVPGAEQLLAGRHNHNDSKDPYSDGTSYVAPLCTMKIVSFEPFEYEYIISTGTVAQMREIFKAFAQK